jgi:L-ascorbate metabolism protein UlaG (beta-lactamase superfamily)
MKTKSIVIIMLAMLGSATGSAMNIPVQKPDTFTTNQGNLIIHFLGHGSLWFEFNHLIIYADPFSKVGNYPQLPKADVILVTHSHMDHMDTTAISAIRKVTTHIFYTEACDQLAKYKEHKTIMKNGDQQSYMGISILAVPAYNLVAKRPDGIPFHPKGEGNGYVVTFGNLRVYIAGDTENIPEMKNLGTIDIAFLPMNLPYTMTPEQTADAAKMVHPKIFYPYHYGNTDVSKLLDLLKNEKEIEIRVKNMK